MLRSTRPFATGSDPRLREWNEIVRVFDGSTASRRGLSRAHEIRSPDLTYESATIAGAIRTIRQVVGRRYGDGANRRRSESARRLRGAVLRSRRCSVSGQHPPQHLSDHRFRQI